MKESDVKLEEFKIEENTAEVCMSAPLSILSNIVFALREVIGNAPNYSELELYDRENKEYYILRIQRKDGKTPHQLRQEAEEKLVAFKKQSVKAVMDLFYAIRTIKGTPTLRDLVKLSKRIKNLNGVT